jgi:hypothetical protein
MRAIGSVTIKGIMEMVREIHSKEIAIMIESTNHINKTICNPSPPKKIE